MRHTKAGYEEITFLENGESCGGNRLGYVWHGSVFERLA